MELAHLFSSAHLDPLELEEAGERIASGERPAPKAIRRERAMGPGLEAREIWLFGLGNILLTPVLGFTGWWGWRNSRPRAARQVFWLSAVVALLLGVGWVLLMMQGPQEI
jgi:hypothetical protein